MTSAAPRLTYRLLRAIERLDDGRLPFMELTRRVGEEAEQLGLPRPSYERIRTLAHELRAIRRRRGPSMAQVFIEAGAGLRSRERSAEAAYTPRDERV
jgi:hypothetical protein